ncbi:MAG: hypothetical protein FWD61_12835 [Phycisphaerales bacterium]|nr:hypothetical protein [Phycisphaerales bacterium]
MKKLIGFIAILCVFHVFAGGALAGYLFLTGRLDSAKMKVITDLARHKGTPDNLQAKIDEILTPSPTTTSAPTTQKNDDNEMSLRAGGGASADERIAFTRQAMEQERILLDRQAQEVQHRQKLLEDRKQLLDNDIQKFEAEKKAFEPKATGADDKVKAENFQKMLALYDELKPRQVKDLWMLNATDPANEELAAAFLTAMDSSRAAKIIAEFKSTQEKTFIDSVMKRIRTAGTSSASGTRTDGNVAVLPK